MSNIVDLRKISFEFRSLSSKLLTSDMNTADINLYRFKKYIDETNVISNIVQEKIQDTEIDYRDCFTTNLNGWNELKIPKEENKHIKAIYDFIENLVNNEIPVHKVAFKYHCSSNKFADMIQNFFKIVIKPLIDYIRDELSKKIIVMEGLNMPGININNSQNSTVNIANSGTQNIINNVNSNNNELLKTIEDLNNELEKSLIDTEIKENIADDLDVIKEQIENNIEKPTRLRKAYNNLNSFLEGSANLIAKAATVGIGIKKVIELVAPYIIK